MKIMSAITFLRSKTYCLQTNTEVFVLFINLDSFHHESSKKKAYAFFFARACLALNFSTRPAVSRIFSLPV